MNITKYINETPELLSMLYDLNLLPEQVQEGTQEYGQMLGIAIMYKSTQAKLKELHNDSQILGGVIAQIAQRIREEGKFQLVMFNNGIDYIIADRDGKQFNSNGDGSYIQAVLQWTQSLPTLKELKAGRESESKQ